MAENERMIAVYVAGPYNANGACNVLANIRNGIAACRTLITWGLAPICPWLDCLYCIVDDVSEAQLKAVSMELMRRADCVYVNPEGEDWCASAGVAAEIAEADRLGIPVFYNWPSLMEWREKREAKA